MRTLLALLALLALAAVGCYHDKYNMTRPKREEYLLPPDESRYNQPDTATYRAPPKSKTEDNLLDRAKGKGPGGSPGGNGLGGF